MTDPFDPIAARCVAAVRLAATRSGATANPRSAHNPTLFVHSSTPNLSGAPRLYLSRTQIERGFMAVAPAIAPSCMHQRATAVAANAIGIISGFHPILLGYFTYGYDP